MAAILSGMLQATMTFVHPEMSVAVNAVLNTPYWMAEHALLVAASVLALWGLTGLYVIQSDKVGVPGLIGFALAFIGTALFVAFWFIEAFVFPLLAAHAPDWLDPRGPLASPIFLVPVGFMAISWGVGYILFGVVTMKANVLPRWGALPLVIWAPVPILAGILADAVGLPMEWAAPQTAFAGLIGVGWVWLGYALWSNKG